jgi:hypothetical protein
MENTERQMTVRDVLSEIDRQLSDLKIPAPEIESIGVVISRAISGIRICIEAMDKADAEAAKQEEPVQLELVAEPAKEGEAEGNA